MKTIAGILVLWFGLLTIQPVIAEVCVRMQTEDCCRDRCEKEDMPCQSGDEAGGKCCMNGVCNPCSICSCCFGATIERQRMRFMLPVQSSEKSLAQSKKALQGYLSSPFQPPELAGGSFMLAASCSKKPIGH